MGQTQVEHEFMILRHILGSVCEYCDISYVHCVSHKYLKAFPWLRGDVPAPSLASFPEMSGIGESSMGDIMFSWKKTQKNRTNYGHVSVFSQHFNTNISDAISSSVICIKKKKGFVSVRA